MFIQQISAPIMKGMHFWNDRWTRKRNEQTPKHFDRSVAVGH
jgi:hypothetical protein